MIAFNTDYNKTELVDQELNFDELQAINAAAASDDARKMGNTMRTLGEGLMDGKLYLGSSGTGSVAGKVVGAASFVGGIATTFFGSVLKIVGA